MSFIFWKNWSDTVRFLYTTAFSLLILSLLALLFFDYRGLENIVQWDVLSELDEVNVVVETNQQTGNLVGKSYILKEQFLPSLMAVPQWFIYGFLGLLLAGWVLILSAVSGLKRWWYVGSMVAFIAIVAFTHLELLMLTSQSSKLEMGLVLAVLLGITYYFHAFRNDVPMPQRVFTISIAVGVLAVVFATMSKNQFAAYTFVSYTLLPMLLITVGFILWLSVEVIAGFVYVVTNPKTGFGKSSLLNFLFLSGLYLLSVGLLYLKINRHIDTNFWFISPLLIYVASVILGIWSFERRTEEFLYFRQVGVWLYAGVALVSTATLCFIVFSANNPHIEVVEDAIVYSQLAMGVAFLVYVVVNFLPLFKQGKAVYKVIYKPMRLMQTQIWLIGLAGIIVLMSFRGFYTIFQARAGHFNNLGDLYTTTGEYKVAEQYYQLANVTDYQNHKSGVALASLALRQNDQVSAGAFFRQALYKDPSPQAYAGLSHVMLQEGLFFDAIFNLRKGIETFQKSGELLNNLGAIYTNTQVADSAYYYLDLASRYAHRTEIPQANLMAFVAKAGLSEKEIPSLSISEPATYLSEEANRLAVVQLLSKQTPTHLQTLSFPADSAVSVNNFAYLYNYAQYTTDTTIAPLIRSLLNTGNNGNFYRELQIANAYSLYKKDKIAAFDVLASEVVADTSQKAALARHTLTHWLNKENINATPNLAALKTVKDYDEALRKSPFSVALLQQSIDFYNQQKQPQKGYEAILRAKRFNQNVPAIQKLYILQALQMSLSEFAADELAILKNTASAIDFADFLKMYENKLNEIQVEQNSFH